MAYFDDIKRILTKLKNVKIKQDELEKVYMQLVDILKIEDLPNVEQKAVVEAMTKVENDLNALGKEVENITAEIKKL